MKKAKELKELRASKIQAQQAIVDGAQKETRDLNDEETTRFDAVQTEIENLTTQIERAVKLEANQRAAAAVAGVVIDEPEVKEKKSMLKRYSLHRALASQLPNGKLEGVEAEYHQEMQGAARNANVTIQGIAIPKSIQKEQRATQQTVTGNAGAFGANLVGEDRLGIIEALRPKPIVESLGARYMRGLTGDAVFVTNDGGIAATWEGETATTTGTANAYGKKTATPKRLSVTVPISLQNLLQSTPDLEAYTVADIRRITENAIDLAAINGSGSGNQPIGILNITGTNSVAAGTNGAAPSWANIVDMETKVFEANVNGQSYAYMVNPGTKGTLKQTLHTAGDAKYLMNSQNQINGYPTGVTTFLPNNLTKGTGSNLNAAIFGDFSNLLIAEWGFYDMVVDNITGKKSGVIEITVNQFLDILVRHPLAFSVVKDWI